ncbi:MAG TPA: TraR/DksA family transcriptional regulator [Nitrospirae bacterium]|nr:TraR/DksA family transcriptional regulator [Nitrospirota bacterium]
MPKKKAEKAGENEQQRRERLRKLLIAKRQDIIKEAKNEIGKFIRGENKQLAETALDDGDWSVVDLAEDLNLRKLTVHKQTLNKIDEALRKLNEGTYGICEDCGSEISEERLKIIPFAIYCVDCMGKREEIEKLESEEEGI